MTSSMARKFFGNDPPLEKVVELSVDGHTISLKVGGIVQEAPENSHLQYNALISYKTLYHFINQAEAEQSWYWPSFATYLQLRPTADHRALEAKLPDFINRHNGEHYARSNQKEVFFLQPLKDIYLYSDVSAEYDKSGNGVAVYALSIIAIFILLIASVNYVNLTTAKSMERAKEVGVKKVMGATRFELVKQFFTESFLLNAIAIMLAITIYLATLPYFNKWIGRTVYVSSDLWKTPVFWLQLFGIFVSGSLISGLYPAFVLSAFKPVTALKTRSHRVSNFDFRKLLVVFQFTASVALIAGTFIIFRQINFMRNKDLGVKIENTLVIPAPIAHKPDSIFYSQNAVFKNEIEKMPLVEKITISSSIPGNPTGQSGGYIRRIEAPESDVHNFKTVMVDEHFFEVFKNRFSAGRNFSKVNRSDKQAVVINESASRLLGYESPAQSIGRKIMFFGEGGKPQYEIIGVIKDYHHKSLKSGFDPMIFGYSRNPKFFTLSIHAAGIDMSKYPLQLKSLLNGIEEKWAALYPGNPFRYFFLDESFDAEYKKDQQFGNVFGVFSCLAIFVASLGLLGLASFTTLQRTKEIGIRKVLGAGVANIVFLLSKDFIRLVLLACVIAVPIVWHLMGQWLNGYAFRISLNWWLFLFPVCIVILIAALTVSYQTIKSALANPASSLRSD
jgi:putative ABC transport system permease protein